MVHTTKKDPTRTTNKKVTTRKKRPTISNGTSRHVMSTSMNMWLVCVYIHIIFIHIPLNLPPKIGVSPKVKRSLLETKLMIFRLSRFGGIC